MSIYLVTENYSNMERLDRCNYKHTMLLSSKQQTSNMQRERSPQSENVSWGNARYYHDMNGKSRVGATSPATNVVQVTLDNTRRREGNAQLQDWGKSVVINLPESRRTCHTSEHLNNSASPQVTTMSRSNAACNIPSRPLPADNRHVHTDNRHVHTDNRHVHTDNSHLPADNSHLPADNSHLPADNRHLPADNSHLPADNSHLPADNSHLPADNSHLPADNRHLPADNRHLPAYNRHLHADNRHLPADNRHLPEDNSCMMHTNEETSIKGKRRRDVGEPVSRTQPYESTFHVTKENIDEDSESSTQTSDQLQIAPVVDEKETILVSPERKEFHTRTQFRAVEQAPCDHTQKVKTFQIVKSPDGRIVKSLDGLQADPCGKEFLGSMMSPHRNRDTNMRMDPSYESVASPACIKGNYTRQQANVLVQDEWRSAVEKSDENCLSMKVTEIEPCNNKPQGFDSKGNSKHLPKAHERNHTIRSGSPPYEMADDTFCYSSTEVREVENTTLADCVCDLDNEPRNSAVHEMEIVFQMEEEEEEEGKRSITAKLCHHLPLDLTEGQIGVQNMEEVQQSSGAELPVTHLYVDKTIISHTAQIMPQNVESDSKGVVASVKNNNTDISRNALCTDKAGLSVYTPTGMRTVPSEEFSCPKRKECTEDVESKINVVDKQSRATLKVDEFRGTDSKCNMLQESIVEPTMSYSREYESLRNLHATLALKPDDEFSLDSEKSASLRFIELASVDFITVPVFYPLSDDRKFGEMWRLATFSILENVIVFATRLAQTGFYYDEVLDDIRCFSCDVRKREWQKSEIPAIKHLELCPECDQANCRDIRNIPVSEDSYPLYPQGSVKNAFDELQQDGDQTDARGRTQSQASVVSSETREGHRPAREHRTSTPASVTSTAARDPRRVNAAVTSTSTPSPPTSEAPAAEHPRYPVQPVQVPHATPNLTCNLRGSYEDNGLPNDGQATAGTHVPGEGQGTGALDMRRAFNPVYATVSKRMMSFDAWPSLGLPSARLMVLAGYYYLGIGDSVRCFYCGVTLRNWRQSDDPWVAHVRFRFSCDYVIAIKGDHFVRQTQVAVARGQHAALPTEAESTPASRPGRQGAATTTTATITASAAHTTNGPAHSGVSSTSTSGNAPSAGLATSTTAGNTPNNSTTRRGGHQADSGSGTDRGRGGKDINTTGATPIVTSDKPRSGDVLQTDAGDSTVAKLASSRQQFISFQSVAGQQTVTVQRAMYGNDQSETGPSRQQAPPTPRAVAATREQGQEDPSSGSTIRRDPPDHRRGGEDGEREEAQLRQLQEDNRRLSQRHACRVCRERRVDTIFMPCGHLCTCQSCATTVRECCLCHGSVRATARVVFE